MLRAALEILYAGTGFLYRSAIPMDPRVDDLFGGASHISNRPQMLWPQEADDLHVDNHLS